MSSQNQKYVFYVGESKNIVPITTKLNDKYSFKVWKPAIYKIAPLGLFSISFLGWWFLHYLNFFSSSNYSIFMIYDDKKIIHYSVVLPKHFRTPFMASEDLQIGPIGTQEKYRGQGLATYVIQKIIETYGRNDRQFWYIVREENNISRRLIERFGFIPFGEGVKKKRFGIGAMGDFIIEKKY